MYYYHYYHYYHYFLLARKAWLALESGLRAWLDMLSRP